MLGRAPPAHAILLTLAVLVAGTPIATSLAPVVHEAHGEGNTWLAYTFTTDGSESRHRLDIFGQVPFYVSLQLRDDEGQLLDRFGAFATETGNGIRAEITPSESNRVTIDTEPGPGFVTRGFISLRMDRAPGTYQLVMVGAANEAVHWRHAIRSEGQLTVDGFSHGPEAFVHRAADLEGISAQVAYQNTGPRAQVAATKAVQVDGVLVGDFLRSLQSPVEGLDPDVLTVTRPDGTTEVCPCQFNGQPGIGAAGPGSYLFQATSLGLALSDEVYLGGADIQPPG